MATTDAPQVVVVQTNGTSNDGESKPNDSGEAVVDLMQIYPGMTNNLDILTFVDENQMDNRQLCMNMCPTALTNYEYAIMGLILGAALTLFVSIWTMMAEVIGFGFEGYSVFVWMFPSILLLSIKLFVFYQFYRFRIVKHNSSLLYHEYGKRFYYSFYGDCVFSLVGSLFCASFISYFCSVFNCDQIASFDESLIFSTVVWLYTVPELLYVIFGYFLVFKMKSSDFEVYYKNWAFRKFDVSNDQKYCLNYHYTSALPTKDTLLCRCCGDCKSYQACCACCNECNGTCGCSNNCCDDGPKCTLIGISVYYIIASIPGIYYLILGVVYIFSGAIFVGSWFYFVFGTLFLIIGLSDTLYHLVAGYYGIRLINYQTPSICNCFDACCKDGSAGNAHLPAKEFQELAIKATKAYSALAVLYFAAFMMIFWMSILSSVFVYGAFNLGTLVTIVFYALIAYLPFEGLKLIDTFIKKENYKERNKNNGAINMDLSNFKDANGASSAADGIENNGTNNMSARQTNQQ